MTAPLAGEWVQRYEIFNTEVDMSASRLYVEGNRAAGDSSLNVGSAHGSRGPGSAAPGAPPLPLT